VVASRYAPVAHDLQNNWHTRREVFELTAPFAPKSKQADQPQLPSRNKIYLVGWAVMGVSLLCVLCSGVSIYALAMRWGWVDNAQTPTVQPLLAPPTIFASPFISPVAMPRITPPAENTVIAPRLSEQDALATVAALATLRPLPTALPAPATNSLGALASPLLAPTLPLPPTFTPRPLLLATPILSTVAENEVTPSPVRTISPVVSPLQPIGRPTISVNVTPVKISALNFKGDAAIKEADEFVELHNVSDRVISFRGWTIGLKGGEQLSFGNGFVLQPNQKCRVYTNSPSLGGECGALSFNRNNELWLNSGGVVVLRDANEVIIDEYIYPK
jgi:hypothetical protein